MLHYTNAACLLTDDYKFDPEKGLFSGWDPETKTYSNASWGYDVAKHLQWDTSEGSAFAWVNRPGTPEFKTPDLKVLKRDMDAHGSPLRFKHSQKALRPLHAELVQRITGMVRT